LTIIFGIEFLITQYEEYKYFPYTVNSGIFGTCFFLLTGFHGLHVLVGVLLLLTVFFRCYSGDFSSFKYLFVWMAALYWHFVDGV